MSVQVGDLVVVVVSDPATPGFGAKPGQLCYLYELYDCALPFRVTWHDKARGRMGHKYWWCQSVRLPTPEELAAHQLVSLPGGQL